MTFTVKQHQNVLRRLYRDRKKQIELNERLPKWRKLGEYRLQLIEQLIAWRKEDIQNAKRGDRGG